MNTGPERTLGEVLEKLREKKGVSIEKMSRDTKIRPAAISALEEGRFEELPPDVFIKGFIKAYANRLDVDAQPILQRFEALRRTQETPSRLPPRKRVFRGRATVRLVVSALAVMVVVSVFVLKGADYSEKGSPVVLPSEATPSGKSSGTGLPAESRAGTTPGTDRVHPGVQPLPAVSSTDLVIDCREDCWLEVSTDGVRKVYRTVRAGKRIALRGKTFILNIGNAHGVEISYRGKRVPLPDGVEDVIKGLRIPMVGKEIGVR